jgi:ubiquinone/menaquinone biosynthesis C-methylase UbiE
VALVKLRPGAVVLDIGTGTGLVAAAAQDAVGPSGRVIGIDGSREMLRASAVNVAHTRIAGVVPHLPFRDNVADAVLAGFVVTHFDDYTSGLAEMVRTCHPRGRVGISAWGRLPAAAAQAWNELAATYVPPEELHRAFRRQVPWEDVFSDAARLRRALEDVGLAPVDVTTRVYRMQTSTADYLEMRETSVQGTLLRRALDERQWKAFRTEVRTVMEKRFGRDVTFERDVHFGVGATP